MTSKPTRYGFGFLSLALLILMTYIESAKAAAGGIQIEGLISGIVAVSVIVIALIIRAVYLKFKKS